MVKNDAAMRSPAETLVFGVSTELELLGSFEIGAAEMVGVDGSELVATLLLSSADFGETWPSSGGSGFIGCGNMLAVSII